MSKESLFKHIRSEDVLLWIGAGFSAYAGYPLGNALRDAIAAALSPEERRLVDTHLLLADFAEEFVRLKNGSKNELVRIVRGIYRKDPTSTSDHDALAAIPHFKTIVTTNYDTLLEKTYGECGNLIFRETDISLLDKHKVNIIKIHGDLGDSESLVLTKTDYATFYKLDWTSPFWAHLSTLMATNVILFIGYSLEDPNVLAMLEHIGKYLKELRKEAFLVAPNTPAHRIAHLNRLGIEVIPMTGAEILREIEIDIRQNIFGDQRQQLVSPETFRTYFVGKRLLPDLTSTPHGFEVTAVRTIDGKPAKGLMQLGFIANSDFDRMHQAFLKGEINDLTLRPEMLRQFQIDIEGIRLLGLDEMGEIRISRQPIIYLFDLTFPGRDLEIDGLKAIIKKGPKATINIKIHNLDVTIYISKDAGGRPNGNLQITRDPIHKTVKFALEAYRLLQYFFTQQAFTIHLSGGVSMTNHAEHSNKEYAEQAKQYIAYFNLMKKVEDFFGIRFRNITDVNDDNLQKLQRLARIADAKPFELTNGPIKLTMSEITVDTLEQYQRLNNEEVPIDIEFTMQEIVEIHGQTITLTNQRIHVPSARLLNLPDLKRGGTREIELDSRTGTIFTYYQEPRQTK